MRIAASGTGLPLAMSANCKRPPGRRTRMTSANTRRLSAQRLMTPLLMTTSAQPASTGKSSMTPAAGAGARLCEYGRAAFCHRADRRRRRAADHGGHRPRALAPAVRWAAFLLAGHRGHCTRNVASQSRARLGRRPGCRTGPRGDREQCEATLFLTAPGERAWSTFANRRTALWRSWSEVPTLCLDHLSPVQACTLNDHPAFSASAPTSNHNPGNRVRSGLAGGGSRIPTLGPAENAGRPCRWFTFAPTISFGG